MKRKKVSRLLMAMMLIGIVLQTGFISYSMIDNGTGEPTQIIEEAVTVSEPEVRDINNTVISQEILNLVKQSDVANFEKNITNYKNLLVKLNVQEVFKSEIERLIKEGHRLPELLIAYEFLNENFGTQGELEVLSIEKQGGKTWREIFKTYNTTNGEFIPRAFEPDYLERLMGKTNITPDDIMIADIIASKLQKDYDDIIVERLDGMSWKEVNGKLGILSSIQHLPRVQVTNEQIEKYKGSPGLTEEQIVDGFVIAEKLGKTEKEMIDKIKAGYSRERIYAECYQERYY